METIKVKICNEEKIILKRASMAIKAKCIDCSCGERNEVTNCVCTDCPLYEFRGWFQWESKYDFSIKNEISDEKRELLGERLRKMREKNERYNNENTRSSES